MFSLVITLIAISLVAALAAVGLYYASQAFTNSQARASAARAVSESNQVRTAAVLFTSDKGREPQTLDELVQGRYLNANLYSSGWESVDGTIQLASMTTEQCAAINEMMGIHGVPSCDDPRYMQRPTCCDASAAAPALDGGTK